MTSTKLAFLLLLLFCIVPSAFAIVEIRYFRSNTATVNGLTTEILGTSNSATFGNRTLLINDAEVSATRYYWGHRTYYRTSGGVETEITSGVSNLFYRSSIGTGWQNANWSCPQTSISSTDSIVVKVYASLWSSADGYAWALLDTWQTGQLGTTIINANPWNFTVWTYLSITTGPPKKWTGAIYFGNSTYGSQILGLKYGETTSGVNVSLLMTETLKMSETKYAEQSLQFYGNEALTLEESTFAPVSLQMYSVEVCLLEEGSISPFALQLIPSEILALLEAMQYSHQTNTSTTPTGPDFSGVTSYLCVFTVTFNSEPTKDVEIKLWDNAGVPLSTLRTDESGSAEIDLKAGRYDYSVNYLQQIRNGTFFIDSAKKILIQLISGESGIRLTANLLMRVVFAVIILICAVFAVVEGAKAKR